jgi:glycosyltransferase involved in cell wall biosynthesis
MRVGIYHQRAAWNQVGGVAVFLQQMAKALAERHTVTIYSSDDGPPVPDVAASDVRVRTVDRSRTRSVLEPLAWVASPNLADRVSFSVAARVDGTFGRIDDREDVLVTGHWIDDMFVSRGTKVPTVFEFHGVNVGIGGKLRDRFSDSVCVLANSETTARAMAELSPVDGIVNPGIDAAAFGDATGGAFDADTDHVITVGRQHREKGIEDLIDGLARLDPVPTLHLVGTGVHSAAFAERATEHGIRDRLVQHGQVGRADLPDLYASADVSCNPSHYESWCMTNVEAMAAGTPVVTSDLPAIREYAEDGDNCLLVPPKSPDEIAMAVRTVLEDDELAALLARRGRETAERYTWQRQSEALETHLRAATA